MNSQIFFAYSIPSYTSFLILLGLNGKFYHLCNVEIINYDGFSSLSSYNGCYAFLVKYYFMLMIYTMKSSSVYENLNVNYQNFKVVGLSLMPWITCYWAIEWTNKDDSS